MTNCFFKNNTQTQRIRAAEEMRQIETYCKSVCMAHQSALHDKKNIKQKGKPGNTEVMKVVILSRFDGVQVIINPRQFYTDGFLILILKELSVSGALQFSGSFIARE